MGEIIKVNLWLHDPGVPQIQTSGLEFDFAGSPEDAVKKIKELEGLYYGQGDPDEE